MRKSGSIIAICGVDGVGKSTLCAGLKRHFSDKAESLEFFSRMKTQTDRLSLTNKYVLPQANASAAWRRGDFATIVSDGLLLDFLESYEERLAPALQRGKVIVCDRYTPCFFAYIRLVQKQTLFEQVLQQLPAPDVVLYLAAPPEILAARQHQRGGQQADEDPILQGEFDAAYRVYLQQHAINWIEVDAAQSSEQVLATACRAIEKFLPLSRVSCNA